MDSLYNGHRNHAPMQRLKIMITTRLRPRITEVIQAHPRQDLVVRPFPGEDRTRAVFVKVLC